MLTRDHETARQIDRGVFPLTQGTPDFAAMAGKAMALHFAGTPAFRELMASVVRVAGWLAHALQQEGLRLVGDGTDTHLLLVDLREQQVTGDVVESALEASGVHANRNRVPDDPATTRTGSGLRLGTNWLAARGVDQPTVDRLAAAIAAVVRALGGHGSLATAQDRCRDTVRSVVTEHPLSPLFN